MNDSRDLAYILSWLKVVVSQKTVGSTVGRDVGWVQVSGWSSDDDVADVNQSRTTTCMPRCLLRTVLNLPTTYNSTTTIST